MDWFIDCVEYEGLVLCQKFQVARGVDGFIDAIHLMIIHFEVFGLCAVWRHIRILGDDALYLCDGEGDVFALLRGGFCRCFEVCGYCLPLIFGDRDIGAHCAGISVAEFERLIGRFFVFVLAQANPLAFCTGAEQGKDEDECYIMCFAHLILP